jgi:signal peptidase
VGIEAEDGLSFVTKGDANNVADSGTVPASRVIGVVGLAIPFLGRLLVFSQSKQGLLTLIIIPALVILVLEGRELWSYAVQMDKERAAKVF